MITVRVYVTNSPTHAPVALTVLVMSNPLPTTKPVATPVQPFDAKHPLSVATFTFVPVDVK